MAAQIPTPDSEPLPHAPPVMPPNGAAPGPGFVTLDENNNQHLYTHPSYQSRLVTQFSQEPPSNLEASSYGFIDQLLNEQLISARKFMIEPQGGPRHRPTREIAEQMNSGLYDLIGGAPRPIPDFIIVKASPFPTDAVVLAVVTIKPHGRRMVDAEVQFEDYLRVAAQGPNVVGKLHGFLILGNDVYTYVLNTEQFRADLEENLKKKEGEEIETEVTMSGPVAAHGPEFKHQLFEIARRYWDDVNMAEWGTYDYGLNIPYGAEPHAV